MYSLVINIILFIYDIIFLINFLNYFQLMKQWFRDIDRFQSDRRHQVLSFDTHTSANDELRL